MAAAWQRSILAFFDVLVHHKHFWRSSRAQRCTMGKNFGSLCINNHVSVRTTFLTTGSIPIYNNSISRYGKCNTGFFGGKPKVHPDFLERESPSGLRREKSQQQTQVRLNFKVFNDVDKKAKALDKKTADKFRWRKNIEIGGEKMRKWEKAANKVKMSGSVEKKWTGTRQNIGEHIRHFPA